MYLKLALRNARRSVFDYLLYIFSMVVLTSILCISNCIANWGGMQAGFQTVSLPLLIVAIMAVLANCINTYIVKQRAKEFATYMLLGMGKGKLSILFLCELSMVGMVCFLLGVVFGTGIFSFCYSILLQDTGSRPIVGIIAKSILQTLACFGLVEILSMIFIGQKVSKLQIVRLMVEKRRGQPMRAEGKCFWGILFLISFLAFLLLLSGISFMPGKVMALAVSVIAMPVLLCVFAFYRWVYAFLAAVRLAQADALYQGNRLYRIAEMTTGSRVSAGINAVFSICLIFSASSFVFGMLLVNQDIAVWERAQQQWMGYLQIGICIIFIDIYFSILSLLQIIDMKGETRNIRFLSYMGKKRPELKSLLRTQIQVKLLVPAVMSFIVLWTAVPFINYKVNSILPVSMNNLLLYAVCGFWFCFFMLYLCYFCVIYMINVRYIKL